MLRRLGSLAVASAIVFTLYFYNPYLLAQSPDTPDKNSSVHKSSTQSLQEAAPESTKTQEAFIIQKYASDITLDDDGTETHQTEARIQILSEAGVQHWGVISFAYQKFNQVLDISYVRVRKPDGTVITTPQDNTQDITSEISRVAPFYTDQREKHVAVKGLATGDVLEYSVQIQVVKPMIAGQFWTSYEFEHDQPITEETLTIRVPAARAIKLKNRGPAFQVSNEGNRRVYHWAYSNPKSKAPESDDSAEWKRARGLNDQPDILLSSFNSWDAVGRWYEELQTERVKPTPEIQAKAVELTNRLTDDQQKLLAIYDYVSTKFRYIGIDLGVGRYQPHMASEVLENGYGDCKDKHTLLASLLTAAGFKVHAALIDSERDIDADVPSPGQVNHVISVVELASGQLWLDTTPEVARFGFLMGPLRGKHALIVRPGSSSGLEMTPLNPDFKSSQTFSMKAKLNDDGHLTGEAERILDGSDFEVLLRSGFRVTAMPQWKDLVQRISYGSGFAGDVSNVNASSVESIDEPFRFSYAYDRKDYADWAHHHTSPPLPVLSLPDIKEGKTVPSAPLWLGVPGEVKFHASMELPKDYKIELPKNVDVKEEFAEYHASYEMKDGAFIADRRLILNTSEVAISSYEKYKSFRKQVYDDHDAQIAVVHNDGSFSSSALSASTNDFRQAIWTLPGSGDPVAAQYEDGARNAFMQNDMESGISALRSAVEKDSKFARAWLLLGSVLGAKRDQEGAIEAFRNALSADATQAISYKFLGFALMAGRKFEEANSVWQRLVKLAPQDSDAQANLGNSQNALKHYSEAAAAFENAVKLSPSKVSLRIMLGNIYLEAENLAKARAAFEEAIKLDSSSMVLNDIAYELAEKNVDLDIAKQYSEKAVLEEEQLSVQIQVDGIKPADVERTVKLAMFWDTLGWIYFRMNDFEHAEKYLKTAWSISQSSTIGEHLGRVYEQRHQKQLAIHTYQLALGAASFGGDNTVIKNDITRLGGTPDTYAGSSDLSQMRTVHLPRMASSKAQAEFFVLFGADGKTEAKFISGTESLRSATKTIASAKFSISLPDEHPAHLVLRGIVGCYQYSGCSIVMMTNSQAPRFAPFAPQ
jgi:tetratricopeptide (TPR) repeat protein/transglutaminase-like putative cysteine protease